MHSPLMKQMKRQIEINEKKLKKCDGTRSSSAMVLQRDGIGGSSVMALQHDGVAGWYSNAMVLGVLFNGTPT